MRLVYIHQVIAWLLIAGNANICAQKIRKDLIQINEQTNERDRRAVDFGLFVRNLLLKSATASNAKANIASNALNLKTTTAAPRRRPTTTTVAAPFFKFPFDFSGHINNKFKNGGYINFDYNDYGGQQPLRPGRRRTTTTTTTTTTTAAPPPPPSPPARRRPIQRRPYGLVGKQNLLPFDYYDDYDYNYDDADPAPTPTTTPAPMPNPNTTRAPQRRPPFNRARAQGRVPQLRNRFVYQFRQPDDTSTNNDATQPAAAETNSQNNNPNNGSDEEAPTNNNGEDANASNVEGEQPNDAADDTNPDVEQDYNDSSDNANPNNNPNNINSAPLTVPAAAPPLPNSNFNFNPNLSPFSNRLGIEGNIHGVSGFNNFGHSDGFQYSPYNNFNLQYQPSSPAGYSVRYY